MPGRIALKGGLPACLRGALPARGKHGVKGGKMKTVLVHRKKLVLEGLKRKGR
jgi:hypothetical protein